MGNRFIGKVTPRKEEDASIRLYSYTRDGITIESVGPLTVEQVKILVDTQKEYNR